MPRQSPFVYWTQKNYFWSKRYIKDRGFSRKQQCWYPSFFFCREYLGACFRRKKFTPTSKMKDTSAEEEGGEAERRPWEEKQERRGERKQHSQELQELLGQQDAAAAGRPSKITLLRRPQSPSQTLLHSLSLSSFVYTNKEIKWERVWWKNIRLSPALLQYRAARNKGGKSCTMQNSNVHVTAWDRQSVQNQKNLVTSQLRTMSSCSLVILSVYPHLCECTFRSLLHRLHSTPQPQCLTQFRRPPGIGGTWMAAFYLALLCNLCHRQKGGGRERGEAGRGGGQWIAKRDGWQAAKGKMEHRHLEPFRSSREMADLGWPIRGGLRAPPANFLRLSNIVSGHCLAFVIYMHHHNVGITLMRNIP